MARTTTGSTNGHSHQYERQATNKSGAPRTTVSADHDHGIVRDDNGKAIRIKRAGKPEHTHRV